MGTFLSPISSIMGSVAVMSNILTILNPLPGYV
jgi:hypothetical protein